MKILYIGDFRGNGEGLRNVSLSIAEHFSNIHEIKTINTFDALKLKQLTHIKHFQPDIIHYIPGPTFRSLIILKIYKLILQRCKTVSSATRPYLPVKYHFLLNFLSPDIILSQSPVWEKLFTKYQIPYLFVPNGIDTNKFHPLSKIEREKIRSDYGFKNNEKVLLHVGHLWKNRNLELIRDIAISKKYKIWIIASSALHVDSKIKLDLENMGCKIHYGYIENIENVYLCADAYLFPIKPLSDGEYPNKYDQIGAIDIPLSILEAMSTNVPVISTKFLGLAKALKVQEDANGFYWFDGTTSDCQNKIEKAITTESFTRELILPLSWKTVFKTIQDVYKSIL